jgi:hypothetical protein
MTKQSMIFRAILIATCLFTMSCSEEDENEPVPVQEITNLDLIKGTWEESNVTHDGVTSTTQIICNGERELFTFLGDNTFSERYFGDSCDEGFDNGTFVVNETSFTLSYDDNSVDIYTIVELNETTLKFNFNDGGVIVEDTYIKVSE